VENPSLEETAENIGNPNVHRSLRTPEIMNQTRRNLAPGFLMILDRNSRVWFHEDMERGVNQVIRARRHA